MRRNETHKIGLVSSTRKSNFPRVAEESLDNNRRVVKQKIIKNKKWLNATGRPPSEDCVCISVCSRSRTHVRLSYRSYALFLRARRNAFQMVSVGNNTSQYFSGKCAPQYIYTHYTPTYVYAMASYGKCGPEKPREHENVWKTLFRSVFPRL